jgi:hypothetical protein
MALLLNNHLCGLQDEKNWPPQRLLNYYSCFEKIMYKRRIHSDTIVSFFFISQSIYSQENVPSAYNYSCRRFRHNR